MAGRQNLNPVNFLYLTTPGVGWGFGSAEGRRVRSARGEQLPILSCGSCSQPGSPKKMAQKQTVSQPEDLVVSVEFVKTWRGLLRGRVVKLSQAWLCQSSSKGLLIR